MDSFKQPGAYNTHVKAEMAPTSGLNASIAAARAHDVDAASRRISDVLIHFHLDGYHHSVQLNPAALPGNSGQSTPGADNVLAPTTHNHEVARINEQLDAIYAEQAPREGL